MLKGWQRNCIKIAEWFPLWIVSGCFWAWWQPEAWLWFQPYIAIGLGVIMLGMGLTLRLADFSAVLRMPKIAAIGVIFAALIGIFIMAPYFWPVLVIVLLMVILMTLGNGNKT
ncbi:MAG: hypothetical protein Q7U18_09185 [Methylobacter sp.]|nr:hypothetical protein [Methylobacter sp.]